MSLTPGCHLVVPADDDIRQPEMGSDDLVLNLQDLFEERFDGLTRPFLPTLQCVESIPIDEDLFVDVGERNRVLQEVFRRINSATNFC